MNINNHLENISFLPEEDQNEIKNIFISTTTTFFEEFKELIVDKNTILLRKKCHTFGSSLMVFNLDECGILLQKISKELKLNNIENALLLFRKLEKIINVFIEHIKKS